MSKPVFVSMSFSPWSEKARWALEHHRVPYRHSEHYVIFGIPYLRWITREPIRDLTVPALVDGSNKFLDSFDIALYAEEHGKGTKLFPKEKLDQIRKYNELSEEALDAGRALLLDRMNRAPQAKVENLPPYLAYSWLKPFLPMLVHLVSIALWYVRKGFSADRKSLKEHEDTFRKILNGLRASLKGDYLLGEFTYADIAMATTLQMIWPVDDRFIRLGKASREAWTHSELAREFHDLVEWRDRIYAKHRPPRYREVKNV